MGIGGRGLTKWGSRAKPNGEVDRGRNGGTASPIPGFALPRQRLFISKIVDVWAEFIVADNATPSQRAKMRKYVERLVTVNCPHALSDECVTSRPPLHPVPLIALLNLMITHMHTMGTTAHRLEVFALGRQRLFTTKLVDAWVEFLHGGSDAPPDRIVRFRQYAKQMIEDKCPQVLSNEPDTSRPQPIIALLDLIMSTMRGCIKCHEAFLTLENMYVR